MTLSDTKPQTELIESRISADNARTLAVTSQSGGIAFENMAQVMEAAKLMAVSQQAVPPHCRNAPGICFAITIQAVEWRMSPYAVAQKSYVVNDRLAYESQLIHAVIEQRAPIQGRVRCRYTGEGDTRQCTVYATPKNEAEPLEYTSPPISQITPKNSPLWKTKPDLQLFYNASRDWARMYFPDVILGVYAEDEMVDVIESQPLPPGLNAPMSPETAEAAKALPPAAQGGASASDFTSPTKAPDEESAEPREQEPAEARKEAPREEKEDNASHSARTKPEGAQDGDQGGSANYKPRNAKWYKKAVEAIEAKTSADEVDGVVLAHQTVLPPEDLSQLTIVAQLQKEFIAEANE